MTKLRFGLNPLVLLDMVKVDISLTLPARQEDHLILEIGQTCSSSPSNWPGFFRHAYFFDLATLQAGILDQFRVFLDICVYEQVFVHLNDQGRSKVQNICLECFQLAAPRVKLEQSVTEFCAEIPHKVLVLEVHDSLHPANRNLIEKLAAQLQLKPLNLV